MKEQKLYGFATDGRLKTSSNLGVVTEKLAKFMLERTEETVDLETRRRIALLAGLTLIGIFALLILGLFSCYQGNVLHGSFDLLMAVFFMGNLYDARVRSKYHFNINFVIILTSLFYIYLYLWGGHEQTGFVWYFTYPLIASFILGSRKGAIASTVMALPVILLFVVKPSHSIWATYSTDLEIRFLCAYIVVGLFSYLNERASEENRKDIYELNQNLETIISDRTEELVAEVERHKEAKRQLKEKELRYRTIFEKSVNAIFVCDNNSEQYLEANPAAEKLAGRKREELISLKRSDIVSTLSKDHRLYSVHPDSSQGIDSVIYNRPNGTQRIAYLYRISLTGQILVEIAQDVTDLREADEKRSQLEERLHQAQKMEAIGNLAGGIAHDFNNILVAIIGFAELSLDDLEDQGDDSTLKRNLQEIYGAGIRAKDLVTQILAYARQTETLRQAVEIRKIVVEISKLLRSTIPTTIDIQTSINCDSFVMADETQLHQVMMNLCTNGAHAMRQHGGILGIDLRDTTIDEPVDVNGNMLKKGSYVSLTISDTGAGIESEIMDSIFDPYFTTKDLGEGTGLGLAVVKGIVESYGGAISVVSKAEKTSFTVYLPVASMSNGQVKQDKKILPGNGELILFVDDEVPIAKIASQMIASLGYSVFSCTSSIEALELFREKSDIIDLVITDMTMPRLTGLDLAAHISEIRPDVPILLCTGYSDKIFPETARQKGVKEFFYKPFNKALLAEKIRMALEDSRRMMQ